MTILQEQLTQDNTASPNSRYVIWANSSAISLRLSGRSSLATPPSGGALRSHQLSTLGRPRARRTAELTINSANGPTTLQPRTLPGDIMPAGTYRFEIPVPMTQPAYWLYVWKATIAPDVDWLYVGRTGNRQNLTVKPPFVRIGEHFNRNAKYTFLAKIKAQNGIRLARGLRHRGEPDYTTLSVVVHGPLFPDPGGDKGLRDQRNAIVAPLETALRDALVHNGYTVLSDHDRVGNLCYQCWLEVRRAFMEHFDLTQQLRHHIEQPVHLCDMHI